jgi:hypothetical protein
VPFELISDGKEALKYLQIFILSIFAFALTGGSSSQDNAAKAQQGVYKQRLKLVDQYLRCKKEAGNDVIKADSCEQYQKVSEALK